MSEPIVLSWSQLADPPTCEIDGCELPCRVVMYRNTQIYVWRTCGDAHNAQLKRQAIKGAWTLKRKYGYSC